MASRSVHHARKHRKYKNKKTAVKNISEIWYIVHGCKDLGRKTMLGKIPEK